MNDIKKIQEFFSKNEGFKVGDKVTYLGYPAIVTATKKYNGRDFVSVSYDKGKGKTKASDILTTDGTVRAVNEANGFKSGKDFINAKLQKYPKAIAKINQLISMVGESNFTMEMAEWLFDFFNNASFESPVNEAKEEDKVEYLNPGKRPIVTNKQGQKFVLQGFVTSGYYLIPYNNEKYWEPSSASKDKWIHEKDINWSNYDFSKEQFNQLKASHSESRKEINKKFQDMNEAKKLQGFKADNYKWNTDEDLYTKVNEGIEKRISEALDKINEELCPAGKAYIKRRIAAGEKSSAYLSGRAVKVCKGQMSGTSKKKTNESLINKNQKPTQKLDNLLNKIKKDFNMDNE
jgi:hypothetical protein